MTAVAIRQQASAATPASGMVCGQEVMPLMNITPTGFCK